MRASERASHESDPAASAAILDQAILTSALRETARRFLRLSFARGCDLSSVFSKPTPGHGSTERILRLFLPFGCSPGLVLYPQYNGDFGFAEIRYFTRTTRGRE